jgi:hypothetical protein
MNTNDIDKQIKDLQRQRENLAREYQSAKAKQNREAFWKGEVYPKLGFIFLICILIAIFGR